MSYAHRMTRVLIVRTARFFYLYYKTFVIFIVVIQDTISVLLLGFTRLNVYRSWNGRNGI